MLTFRLVVGLFFTWLFGFLLDAIFAFDYLSLTGAATPEHHFFLPEDLVQVWEQFVGGVVEDRDQLLLLVILGGSAGLASTNYYFKRIVRAYVKRIIVIFIDRWLN